jgi:flagellar biosynthesis protein FlhA
MAIDRRLSGFLLAVGLLVILLIILIPLPAKLLDILIALNLIMAILTFLIVLYSGGNKNFSLLPTSIQVSSIFGLVVNVAAASLILTKGADFDGWAIQTIASLAVSSGEMSSVIVGFSIFVVIAIVVLRVIVLYTRRTAKVEIRRKKDFYDELDGAEKINSGNAIIWCLITLITVLGGIAIDVLLRGGAIVDALKIYIPLSIGSGSLSLFPLLLLSIAAASDVSRKDTTVSLKTHKESPDMPQGKPLKLLPDALCLELGFSLIPLGKKDRAAGLLERIQGVRRQVFLDLGIRISKVRIIDNLLLDPSEYCVKVRGVDVGRGKIRLGNVLCISPGTVTFEIEGEKTVDPAFGLEALWVNADRRYEAKRAGYIVEDPAGVIATHLTEIIMRLYRRYPGPEG